jgi:hypothetical protein
MKTNLDQEALLALGDRIPFAHSMIFDAAGQPPAHCLVVKPAQLLP